MLFFRICTFALAASICGMANADETASSRLASGNATVKRTPSEIAPGAASIWKGHVALYREGWRAITSTEQAFQYAREHGVTASGRAIAEARAEIGEHGREYEKQLKESGSKGVQLSSELFAGGTKVTSASLGATVGLARLEWDYGSAGMAAAWNRFYKGYMSYGQRTDEDMNALKAVRWYQGLNDDFSNLNALTDAVLGDVSPHIKVNWANAYDEARSQFDEAYQLSGTRENSLSGLDDLLTGYANAIYSGLVKPASYTAVQGAEATAQLTEHAAAKLVFLPTTKLLMIGGRTVESTGLTLYYTTSMGVKLVSPTVEGGLLAGLSLLTYATVPVTTVAGGTVGVVNQVAITAASPVAGAGYATVNAVSDTGLYTTQVSYDMLKGTTKVVINVGKSGVALGYNAITAIPAHLVMGGGDALLLVVDGTRLAIATVSGEVQWSGKNGEKGTVPVMSLPVGSVVDVDALSREPGVQVKVISDDPAVVEKVLEKLPEDLREKEKQP